MIRSLLVGASLLACAAGCGVDSEDPGVEGRSQFALAGSPALGPEIAAVTVVVFEDFQCSFCARMGPTLRELRRLYPDDVRIVFKHRPLDTSAFARPAHRAAQAAHLQGRFWEMHDLLFARQADLPTADYIEWAEELGLDGTQFRQDLASASVRFSVEEDVAEAEEWGVRGAPILFANGREIRGAVPIGTLRRVVQEALEEAP